MYELLFPPEEWLIGSPIPKHCHAFTRKEHGVGYQYPDSRHQPTKAW
jgi:hypothetical protein